MENNARGIPVAYRMQMSAKRSNLRYALDTRVLKPLRLSIAGENSEGVPNVLAQRVSLPNLGRSLGCATAFLFAKPTNCLWRTIAEIYRIPSLTGRNGSTIGCRRRLGSCLGHCMAISWVCWADLAIERRLHRTSRSRRAYFDTREAQLPRREVRML